MPADRRARLAAFLLAPWALASLPLTPRPAPAADEEATTLVPPPPAHTLGFRRVTRRELALVMPGTSLGSPGGVAVTRLDATNDPARRSDDDEVTVVAVDTAGGAIFASFGLTKPGRWTGAGTSLGPLAAPTDAAIDAAGRIAVTDTGNRRVVVLQHDGRSLTPIAAHEGFLEPRGIADDGAGGFFVCDRAANAVFHLDGATGRRSTFGLEAAFDRPIDVATIPEGDKMANGKRRVVVVSDRDGTRLRSFDPVGALKATREARSLGVAGASFDAIDIDFHGNVFAVDRAGNRLHKLRDDLVPLVTFGSRGTSPGQFLAPRGIAIYRRFGQVFLTEEDGGQYLWIGTDIRDLRASAEGGGARLEYRLTEESLVELSILDGRGQVVAEIAKGARQAPGSQAGFWDGTDAAGRRQPGGDYVVEVRARATYASRSSFECRRSTRFTLPAATPR